jgi:hypothetical protein
MRCFGYTRLLLSIMLLRRASIELLGLVTHLRLVAHLRLGSVVLLRLLTFEPHATIPTVRTTWRSCVNMLVVPRTTIPLMVVVVVPPIVGYPSIPCRYSSVSNPATIVVRGAVPTTVVGTPPVAVSEEKVRCEGWSNIDTSSRQGDQFRCAIPDRTGLIPYTWISALIDRSDGLGTVLIAWTGLDIARSQQGAWT